MAQRKQKKLYEPQEGTSYKLQVGSKICQLLYLQKGFNKLNATINRFQLVAYSYQPT